MPEPHFFTLIRFYPNLVGFSLFILAGSEVVWYPYHFQKACSQGITVFVNSKLEFSTVSMRVRISDLQGPNTWPCKDEEYKSRNN